MDVADDPTPDQEAGPPALTDPSAGRTALLGAITGLLLFLAGGGWYLRLDHTSTRLEGELLRRSLTVARTVMVIQSSLNSFLATNEPRFLKTYRHGLGALTQQAVDLQAAGQALAVGEAVSNAVKSLNVLIGEWQTIYANPAIGYRQLSGSAATINRSASSKLGSPKTKGAGAEYADKLNAQIGWLDGEIGRSLEQYRARISSGKRSALVSVVAGLVLTLGTGWVYIRRRHIMLDHLRSRSIRLAEIAEFERRLHHVTSAEMAARNLRAASGRRGARCAVLLRRDRGPGLRIADESGPSPAGAEQSTILTDHMVCPVMRSGSRFAIRDVALAPACDCPLAAPVSGGYLCEPLLARGQVAGLVNWQAGPGRVLRDRDTDQVEELARATSLVLNNLFILEGAQHDANTDPLTGVGNRRFLDGYLAKQVAVAVSRQRQLAVLMLDLDKFKSFNDRNGHAAGDALLKAAARAIESQVRDGDLVARYGGEEFTVVLPEADRAQARDIADRIRAAMESMVVEALPGLQPPVVTVSIGLAMVPEHSNSAGALLKAADDALYRAKEGGRNRVVEAGAPA